MKERGLYDIDGTFRGDRKIKRDLILKGELPVFETPLPGKKNWDYWSARFIAGEKQHREALTSGNQHVIITLPPKSLLSFMGDLHVGNPWTFHERIYREIEVIRNTPNSYLILGGDGIDGFFFNPAQMEQFEQAPQQVRYLRSLIEVLGEEKKLLVAWSGDHDGWGKKMGFDPYVEFAEKANSYFMHGVGHVTFNVGESQVRLTAAHQLPGHSIYNKAHPGIRASKEIQGADMYANFHTHKKAHLEQGIDLFGGDARWVHSLSAGPYKATDEYARKKGWQRQNPKEMFGFSIEVVEGDDIIYHKDILKAHERFIP